MLDIILQGVLIGQALSVKAGDCQGSGLIIYDGPITGQIAVLPYNLAANRNCRKPVGSVNLKLALRNLARARSGAFIQS